MEIIAEIEQLSGGVVNNPANAGRQVMVGVDDGAVCCNFVERGVAHVGGSVGSPASGGDELLLAKRVELTGREVETVATAERVDGFPVVVGGSPACRGIYPCELVSGCCHIMRIRSNIAEQQKNRNEQYPFDDTEHGCTEIRE